MTETKSQFNLLDYLVEEEQKLLLKLKEPPGEDGHRQLVDMLNFIQERIAYIQDKKRLGDG